MSIRKETLCRYSDSWTQPDGQEVRELLKTANLTGSKAAAIVGVNSRTIRKWTGEEQKIPYSAWAILVEVAGLGSIWK
ncbi:helix-turn-helix domain-containing protein [Kistimonas asteriae]|uniref:helix-turn-helix domain-containing protein n=1 Tax=Kistimonas asteriae TaxID=517724 RepID=UPI0024847750|nr:transcriptional regulator [Kistimonas asteriae]